MSKINLVTEPLCAFPYATDGNDVTITGTEQELWDSGRYTPLRANEAVVGALWRLTFGGRFSLINPSPAAGGNVVLTAYYGDFSLGNMLASTALDPTAVLDGYFLAQLLIMGREAGDTTSGGAGPYITALGTVTTQNGAKTFETTGRHRSFDAATPSKISVTAYEISPFGPILIETSTAFLEKLN